MLLVCGATGLAARSLFDHVRAVARPLKAGDLVRVRVTDSDEYDLWGDAI